MVAPNNTAQPIFLVGNPRSGTSLLSRMLNSHPRMCVPYEAHAYNIFWDIRHRYEPLTDPRRQRRLVNDVLSMRVYQDWSRPPNVESVVRQIRRPNFHGVFEALLRAWANGQGKPRWGEKTPQHGPYWRAIHQGFPNAKFIHLVRDGRDCALSVIDARFGPKLTLPAAIQWARYIDTMQTMCDDLGSEHAYEMYYEDLVNQPEQALRGLCAFLGEAYHPQMLQYHTMPDNYKTDLRNRENLRKPVISGNTGKWRTRMSVKNQRLFEAVAGEQLEHHRYPRLHPDARVSSWQRFSHLHLLHPPLRALSMARNTKGWMDSLVMLLIRVRLVLCPIKHTHTAQ